MNIKTAAKWFCTGLVFLFYTSAQAQCLSDNDCKGSRICESGACVTPTNKTTPEPATPTEAPATTPAAPASPCDGVDCSGQGLCTIQNNAPRCACNTGYQVDDTGTQCLSLTAVPAAVPATEPAAVTPAPEDTATTQQPQQMQPAQQTQPAQSDPYTVSVPQQNQVAPQKNDVNQNEKRRSRLALGHVFFWSGLALTAFGGISTGVAVSAANEYNQTFRSDDESRARAFTGLMFTGYIAGVTCMTLGIIMWASAPKETPQTQTVSLLPSISPNELGLTLTGRW